MSNILLIENAMAMNSKSPMTQIESSVVCTNEKVFIVPKKSVGQFVIFNTIRNHDYFNGKTIEKGLTELIKSSTSDTELQNKLSEILNNDSQYVLDLRSASKKTLKGFLGKKTLTVRNGTAWSSFTPKDKTATKSLVEFYNNKL